jgi:hypothetical protein
MIGENSIPCCCTHSVDSYHLPLSPHALLTLARGNNLYSIRDIISPGRSHLSNHMPSLKTSVHKRVFYSLHTQYFVALQQPLSPSSVARFWPSDMFLSPVSRIDSSISSVIDFSLFFLYKSSVTVSEESNVVFLKYILDSSVGILLLSPQDSIDIQFLSKRLSIYSSVTCQWPQKSHFRRFNLLDQLFS